VVIVAILKLPGVGEHMATTPAPPVVATPPAPVVAKPAEPVVAKPAERIVAKPAEPMVAKPVEGPAVDAGLAITVDAAIVAAPMVDAGTPRIQAKPKDSKANQPAATKPKEDVSESRF